MILSVLIRRPGIFQTCLLIVVRFAQRLPVTLVPEEAAITTVRNDMVDNRRLNVSSLRQAHYAQRMSGKVLFSNPLPGVPVTAG